MSTHLNPMGKILGGVGITSVNTFLFLSELSSASIASFHLFQYERILHSATSVNTFLFLSELSSASITSFHLFQYERILHSAMVLGSGSAMVVEKHGLTIVVLR
jgi:hypothetical protein